VQQELAEVSRAVILTNLTELVDGLEVIKNDLQEIHITTKSLQDSSNDLARSKLHECRLIRRHREKVISLSLSISLSYLYLLLSFLPCYYSIPCPSYCQLDRVAIGWVWIGNLIYCTVATHIYN
jgi:hypothetical protein